MTSDDKPIPLIRTDAPAVSMKSLDILWFQVGGTICNLRCHHCFISCTPENDKFNFLSLEFCRKYLMQSIDLGVREYYFTGGEPFANPQFLDILEETLRIGPATVLTNGTLLSDRTLERLSAMNDRSPYSLEFRVSIDGCNAEMNDPIRGRGTFDRAMEGVRRLAGRGFLPIVTIMRSWEGEDDDVLAPLVRRLQAIGNDRPRLKVLPSIKLGEEVLRCRTYHQDERVTAEMMDGYDESQLVCSHSRLVTDQGVWVCPILLDEPDGRLGDRLSDTMISYPLRHQACFTCWQYGAICSNPATSLERTTDV
jgi:sulfatase maturation enzyme AslB (radical SAM superfamily)